MRRLVLLLPLLLAPSTATAQEVHLDLGVGVGFLIAGDSAVRGRKANPTGGATLLPHGRVSVSIPGLSWLDAVYTQSPLLVTPFSLDSLGFIDANDLGVSLHPANRSFAVVLSGTFAPSYMRFCNVKWCLKEGLIMGGAEAHITGAVVQDKTGRGLHVNIAGRLLYARPTAWTWPGLSAADKQIIPTMGMITGSGAWVF